MGVQVLVVNSLSRIAGDGSVVKYRQWRGHTAPSPDYRKCGWVPGIFAGDCIGCLDSNHRERAVRYVDCVAAWIADDIVLAASDDREDCVFGAFRYKVSEWVESYINQLITRWD